MAEQLSYVFTYFQLVSVRSRTIGFGLMVFSWNAEPYFAMTDVSRKCMKVQPEEVQLSPLRLEE